MEDVMNETPTSSEPQILNVTDNQATIQSANGRIIVVSRLGALDYYRLTKVLGTSASNPAAADLAMLAASVVKIDEHLIPRAVKESEIEHTIQMLDFPGLAAVGEGLKRLGEQAKDGIDAAKN
jgi:hypothetical protein